MQLDMASFKNGSNFDSEGFAAGVALPDTYTGGLALQLSSLADNAAMGANRTMRPQLAFDERESGFFVVEIGGGEDRGHDVLPWYDSIMNLYFGYVKYNIAIFMPFLRAKSGCSPIDTGVTSY